jgi:3-hydroxymyristoyl/3-hydroxydecanoyl-(acyl carrier protein) dehydratase
MPGCLGLDAMWQLAGFFRQRRVHGVARAKRRPERSAGNARFSHTRPAQPGCRCSGDRS